MRSPRRIAKSVRSEAELAQFFRTAKTACSPRDALLFFTTAEAGLRPGEVCALQWEDVDLVTKQLHIQHAVDPVTGSLKPPKMHETRYVDMTPRLVARLRGWQLQALVDGEEPSPFLFPSRRDTDDDEGERHQRDGGPVRQKAMGKRFVAVALQAEISRHTQYDLWHTFATLRCWPRAPRSSPAITFRVYAHSLPWKEDQRWMERAGATWAAAAEALECPDSKRC